MKFELIPIDKLKLDMSNPRIARVMEMYEKPTAEQISLALGMGDGASDSGTTFTNLRESIKTNQGIIHPIIVNKEKDDTYTVIEGNTRVAIYQEFKKKNIDGDWSNIPAMVYDNIEQNNIDAIRLQSHLVGPRQWDPYSKAKYLAHLRDNENLTWNQIVDYCGGKAKEAEQYVNAYYDMEKHYKSILGDDIDEFDPTRFSAFSELQNQRIKQSVLLNGFTIDDFAKWVHERLIDPITTVRSLPIILNNEKSKSIFLSQGAKEALKYIDSQLSNTTEDIGKATISQLARALINKIQKINFTEIRDFKQNSESPDTQVLFDLKEELREFIEAISVEH